MSRNIWTQCGGRSNVRALSLDAWRVVEGQHVISTRKLVDSDDEQQLLEELLDASKPPIPSGAEFKGLHYLLSTPFRYPPLPYGSRFGTRAERSLWYGSARLSTGFAEVGYYRMLFIAGTRAKLTPLTLEMSAFATPIATTHGVDLSRAPFDEHAGMISSKTEYVASQALGAELRREAVEAALYVSARDPEAGHNVALFSPAAFARKRPRTPELWLCTVDDHLVEFLKRDVFRRTLVRFERKVFEVRGKLPSPAV